MNNETKKGKLVPELRFPGFEGNWEVKRLGEIADNNDSRRKPVSKSDRKSGTYPYYGANGIQDYVEGFIFDGYFLLIGEDGSVINENDTPVLNWASGKIWVNNHAHVLSENNLACLKFIYYALGVVKISGLVTGIPPKLNQDNLNRIKIALPPSLPEQQKIAECLSGVDDLIQAEADQLQALKDHKKGLMQQLFPQEGETTPKLRFPGFNGAWEEKKLGEIGAFSKGKGISKDETDPNGVTPCIRYGELYTKYGEQIYDVFSMTNLPLEQLVLSEINDVIIPASGETHEDIATASCVLKSGIAIGGDINIIKTPLNGVFLSFFLNSALKHQIARIAQGDAVVHLYGDQLKKLNIKFPTFPEQQKIADCLSSLDEEIAAQQRKVEALKEHKKGLVQKLFTKI